jgi:hypothetical protein
MILLTVPYFSYAASTHYHLEMEAMQSHFAQLQNMRPIPVGAPHRHVFDRLPKK